MDACTRLAAWSKKRTTFFFLKSQFYCCTDLHATYKLAPAGTLRFAQSPLRGLAIIKKKHVFLSVRPSVNILQFPNNNPINYHFVISGLYQNYFHPNLN